MVKQYGAPKNTAWLFGGFTFIIIGLVSVFALTFGLLTFLLSAIIAYAGYWFFFRPAFIQMDVMKKGEPAMAIILDVWETGITVDHGQRLGMLLEIRHQNRIPYEVEVKYNVRREFINYFKSGRTLQVKVDTMDPGKIAILPR